MDGEQVDHYRLRAYRDHSTLQFLQNWRREVVLLRLQRLDFQGPAIGDPSCLFNARSARLRCAVNPNGPCEGCLHYQACPADPVRFQSEG
jgi:hypothetical protein